MNEVLRYLYNFENGRFETYLWADFWVIMPLTFLFTFSQIPMLLKNGFVLLDEINSQLASGKGPYQAVFDSGVSRVRPVAMAGVTTILGMVPLLGQLLLFTLTLLGVGVLSLAIQRRYAGNAHPGTDQRLA